MEYGGLGDTPFSDNAEPRCPVVLVLDTSYSMSGDPIRELNDGVALLASELKDDSLARQRVELAVVTFGGSVQALDVRSGHGTVPFDAAQAFALADEFSPPTLRADGDTPMGEAMRRALELIRDRKEIYKSHGLDYYRPWIFLMSDGAPNDAGWESAADHANQEEARKGVLVFAIGVSGADMRTLARFTTLRPPLLLSGLKFKEFFMWMSRSLAKVSESKPGEQVPLPAVDWGTIPA